MCGAFSSLEVVVLSSLNQSTPSTPLPFRSLGVSGLVFFSVAQNFVIMRHCGKVGGHELAAQLREPTTLTAITREVKAPEFDPHFYREVPTPERGTCRGCKVCHQPRACACLRRHECPLCCVRPPEPAEKLEARRH